MVYSIKIYRVEELRNVVVRARGMSGLTGRRVEKEVAPEEVPAVLAKMVEDLGKELEPLPL